MAIVFDGTPIEVSVTGDRINSIQVTVAGKQVFTNVAEAAEHCYTLFERTEETEAPISNSVLITFNTTMENSAIENICGIFVRHRIYPITVSIIRENITTLYDYSPGFLTNKNAQQAGPGYPPQGVGSPDP